MIAGAGPGIAGRDGRSPPGPPRGGCSATRPPPPIRARPRRAAPKARRLATPAITAITIPPSNQDAQNDDGPARAAAHPIAGRAATTARSLLLSRQPCRAMQGGPVSGSDLGANGGPQRVDDDSSQRRRAQAPAPAPTLDALPNITSRPRSRVLVYTLSLPRAVPSLLPRTMFRQLPPGRLTTQRSSL